MKKITRIILTSVTFLATFYFIYWVPFSLIPEAGKIPFLPIIISMIVATGIGLLVWKSSGKRSDNLFRYVFMGGIITGAILFLAGFIGPMIFMPSNNLGPIIGIFYTGPTGFLLGLLGGGIYWRLKVGKNQEKG